MSPDQIRGRQKVARIVPFHSEYFLTVLQSVRLTPVITPPKPDK